MLRCLVVLSTLVSGCASKHELARCHGRLIALNSNHWVPTADEMSALAKLCPEDR